MDWSDIVFLSVVFGLKNWFQNKKIISALKEFIIVFISFSLPKFIFSFIKIPGLPDSFSLLLFSGIIIWITIDLLIRAYKKNKT